MAGDFQQRLQAAGSAPYSVASLAALEALVAEAAASASLEAETLARLRLVEVSYYLPDRDETIVHLAWLRQHVDDPRVAVIRHRVLWVFKWSLERMMERPDIALAAVADAVDDVEECFRRHGRGTQAIAGFRAQLAERLGDQPAAERHLAAWIATPRDDLSDCLACDPSAQARIVADSDPERALALLAPVLDGNYGCASQPATSQAQAALLLQRLGRLDEARRLAEASWATVRGEVWLSSQVAECLVALTRLGDGDRSLDRLLPRLDWMTQLHTAKDRMWFAAGGALVLAAAQADGRLPARIGGRPGIEVLDEWRRLALDIAAEYDARAGNTVVSRRIKDRLDLGLVTPVAPAEPDPVAADLPRLAAAVRAKHRVADPSVATEIVRWERLRPRLHLLPRDRSGWQDVALLDRSLGWRRLEPTRSALLAEAADAAVRADDDIEGRVIAALQAVIESESAGGETAGTAGDRKRRLASIEATARQLIIDAPVAALAVWRAVAHAHEAEESQRALAEAVDAATGAGLTTVAATLRIERAARLAPVDPGAAQAELARLDAEASQHSWIAAGAALVHSQLAVGEGDLDVAERQVRGLLDGGGDGTPVECVARHALSWLLGATARWHEAVAESARVVDLASRLGLVEQLPSYRLGHAQALLRGGHGTAAAEILEALALDLPAELAVQHGWLLGEALTGAHDDRGARRAYARLATVLESTGDGVGATVAQQRAGDAALGAGDPVSATIHYEAALAGAQGHRLPVVYAAAARGLAAAHADRDEPDAEIAALAELDQVLDGALALIDHPDDPDAREWLRIEQVNITRQGAELLLRVNQPAEAADRLQGIAADVDGDLATLIRAEHAAALAAAGRLREAEPTLRKLVPRLAPGRLRQRVVIGWLQALDAAGRGDEADRLWEEYG